MPTPIINGSSYAWANISLNLFGRTVEGIVAIMYKKKQDKTNNYGRGNEPVSRGRGKVEYEASITLEMKEVEAIQLALPPGGSLMDVPPFDIPIAFAGDDNVLVTHVLRACEFLENGRDSKQGDSSIEVELPLIIAGIEGM